MNLESIELRVDDFNNNLVYGCAKNKENNCVFLADMLRNKLLAVGFLPLVEDFKVNNAKELSLVVLTNNGSNNILKTLVFFHNKW